MGANEARMEIKAGRRRVVAPMGRSYMSRLPVR